MMPTQKVGRAGRVAGGESTQMFSKVSPPPKSAKKERRPHWAPGEVYMPINVFFSDSFEVEGSGNEASSVYRIQIMKDKVDDFRWKWKGRSCFVLFITLYSRWRKFSFSRALRGRYY